MKLLTKSVEANKPKTGESQTAAYMYSGILAIFALTQLFTFDEFIVLIEKFGLPVWTLPAQTITSIIVILEVLSLPFLLRLKLSPLMRFVSMVFSWSAAALWLKLVLWITFTSPTVSNVGFFGTMVDLIPGWWAVFVSLAICLLAAWASWGLWPVTKHTQI